MICAWQPFVSLLPLWLRESVDKLGKDNLLELRLRLGFPPDLRTKNGSIKLERKVTAEDLCFCINVASHYSPWLSETADNGYITAPGGHRIGLCGNATALSGSLTDISGITSLCLRVARDFLGISKNLLSQSGSVLIIGSPGRGKTTLLRDLIRSRSQKGEYISVVDERCELFPRVDGAFCFDPGLNTDVLSGYEKRKGIFTVLRTMGPDVIAVDEITNSDDCEALYQAGWCGVKLIATAHASNKSDLYSKALYRRLVDNKLFDTLVTLNKDKTYTFERLNL